MRKFGKNFKGLAFCVAAAMVGTASMVSAQAQLPTLWSIPSGAGGPAWFPGGDVVRGMAFNPATGNLLATTRAAGFNNIQIINGATGAVAASPMNVTGIAGGTFAFNKIQAVDRGAGNYSIYVANLASSSEGTTASFHPTVSGATNAAFRLYRYTGAGAASEDTIGAPVSIYRNNCVPGVDGYAGGPLGPDMPIPVTDTNALNGPDAYRLGDAMDAEYDPVNNVTRLYLPYRQVTPATLASNAFLVFTIDETTGTVTSVDRFTTTGALGNSFYSTVPFGANTVYHASGSHFGRYVNADATPADYEVQTLISNFGNAVVCEPHPFTANGKTFVAYLRGGETNGFSRFRVGEINTAGGLENTFSVEVAPLATPVTNSNVSGEFHYDAATGRLYGLVGNNQIAAVQFGRPGEGNNDRWDGGAGTANWVDAANWEGDTVPVPAQGVVLNNDLLAGSYSVTTPNTTPVFAHTVSVNASAPNTVQLSIPNTSTATVALHVLSNPAPSTADIQVGAGGYVINSSTAASGDVVFNRNTGATMVVGAGGIYEHNTARSFGTPFPATGAGTISFAPTGTMIFDVPGSGAVSFSNRTFGNLTFQLPSPAGTGYTAAGAAATVIAGTLTVDTGAIVNLSGHTGTQTLQGSIANNGTLTFGGPATGPVLNASSAASVTGNAITFPTGFEVAASSATVSVSNAGTNITTGSGQISGPVQIGPAGTHVLNGTVEVNSGGSATFLSGAVDATAGTVRAEIGSTINSFGGWVFPDFVYEVAAATGTYNYPVGNATTALPMGISFPSDGPDAVADLTVTVVDGDEPAVSVPNQPIALNRWWDISDTIPANTFAATLFFTYDDPADLAPGINESNLKIAREDTPGVFIMRPTLVNAASNTLFTTTPVTGFSDWTAFESAALSVDLTSFSAAQTGSTVTVSWETAAELDNAGFSVYRANADGSRGEKLSGLIPAEGSEVAGASYSFVDSAPFAAGEASRSYLLVDIDLSGSETTHGPATATISTGSPSSVPAWTLY